MLLSKCSTFELNPPLRIVNCLLDIPVEVPELSQAQVKQKVIERIHELDEAKMLVRPRFTLDEARSALRMVNSKTPAELG